MKYVVVGGAGFIGSNLVDGLIDDGHEVIIIDDLSTGKEDNFICNIIGKIKRKIHFGRS